MQLLPRVISEHLQWLMRIWKKRCTLVHTGNGLTGSSITSSQTTSSQQSLTTLPSLRTRTRRRTRSTRRNRSLSVTEMQTVQTSLLPFTADTRPEAQGEIATEPQYQTPVDEDVFIEDFDQQLHIDNQTPLVGSRAPFTLPAVTQPTSPTTDRTTQGRGRCTLWNLRGSTQLYEYPSSCPVRPIATSWEELNGVYIPAMEG